MIVVGIYRKNAESLSGLTIANDWKDFLRRLSYYFSDVGKVKDRIIAGEVISIPYLTLQKDRRVKQEKRIENERRK